MGKCKCVNCGITREINDNAQIQDYVNVGFRPIWNTDSNLKLHPLCKDCYEILRTYIIAVENITKLDIDSVGFIDYDNRL